MNHANRDARVPVIRFPGPRFTFIFLAIVWLVLSLFASPWHIIGIVSTYFGTLQANPRFNLLSGCLVLIIALIGILLIPFMPYVAIPIFAGATGGWFLGCIETAILARLVDIDEQTGKK